MANSYPNLAPLAAKYLNAQLVDISTASIAYVPVPAQGVVVNVLCSIANAITGTDSVVTVKKVSGGTTTTIGTVTALVTGSAAGTTFQLVITGTEAACSVKQGDSLVFDSDGASSTTAVANFTAVIRET